MSKDKRDGVVREVERKVAAAVGRALLARLLGPDEEVRKGLPADLVQAIELSKTAMGQVDQMGKLLHFSRARGAGNSLMELSPDAINAYAHSTGRDATWGLRASFLGQGLRALKTLAGMPPASPGAGAASSPPADTVLPAPTKELRVFNLPFHVGISELLGRPETTSEEHAAIFDFARFVDTRYRLSHLHLLGRRHFEEYLENRIRAAGDPGRLGDFVRPLETFAQVIDRRAVLELARNRVHEKTRDRLREETAQLFQQSPALLPHQGPIEDFLEQAEKESGAKSLKAIGLGHLVRYVERLFEQGRPAGEIEASRAALEAFARNQRRWQDFVPVFERLSFVPELREQGGCWIAGATSDGEEQFLRYGFAAHAHPSPFAECPACTAGVPKGSWWTDQVLRAERVGKLATMAVAVRRRLQLAAESFRARSHGLSEARRGEKTYPVPEGKEYLPFQKAGIEYALLRRRTLLADEMGLGKTIQALGLMNALPSAKRILVVAPAGLLLTWKREAEDWLVGPRPVRVLAGPGALSDEPGVSLVSYSMLPGLLGDQVREKEWDLVVADEAHYVKNPKAERSKAFYGAEGRPGILERAERVVFLSGTPILNRVDELVALVSKLDPWLWDREAIEKALAPSSKGRLPFAVQLRQTLMIRRMKADVLPDLPQKFPPRIVPVSPGTARQVLAREGEILKLHARAIASLKANVEGTKVSAEAGSYERAVAELKEAKFGAILALGRVRHETALAKLPSVVAHVEGLLVGGLEKVVVWAHHRNVVDGIADHFGSRGVRLYGMMAQAERQLSVERFQNDPGCQVFVGSFMASGLGHTLTAASHEVFAELDWTPGNLSQAEDRCHRIGQKKSVVIEHLVVDGSLDARMAKVLVEKQKVIKDLLEGDCTPDARAEEEQLEIALRWAEEAA